MPKNIALEEPILLNSHENDNEIPSIQKTKDFSIFKTLEGNRKVSETHVKNLMDFIKRRNLLKFNPILINDGYEVIDGQHRLEAAKELGIPIYFIQGKGLSYKDAGVLNACSDDWEFKEYLEMYIKNGHQEYIRLQKFKEEHNLNLKRFQFLMSTEQKSIFNEKFKIGTFHIIDDLNDLSEKIRKIDSIIEYLEEIILSSNKRFIYTDNFWRALYLFLKKDVDVEKLKEKISIKYQSITQKAGYKDYLNTFIEMYNWKAKKRIE